MKVAHVQMIYQDLPIQKCALFMAISAFKRVSVSDQTFSTRQCPLVIYIYI